MTVNSEDTPRVQYTANSITTIFPITFVYDEISDVHVYFISNSTGLATAWTKDASGPTGYTVSAGAIVANTAPSNGYLVAVCTTPVTQLVDVKPNRALTADTLEGVFDKLTLIGRDLKGSVSRALIYGPTYTGSIPYAEDLADEIKQDSVDASVAAVNALTFATSLHIDNLAALRLFSGGETTSIYLDCHTTNGDGLHGTFYWDATSTDADDGQDTIAVTGVSVGRWKRNIDPITGELSTHINLTAVHGSTDAPTAGRIVQRDVNGCSSFAPGTGPSHAVIVSQLAAAVLSQIMSSFDGDFSNPNAGWIKFPNGLMVQWGVYLSGINAAVTHSWPVEFPDGCFAAVGQIRNQSATHESTITVINAGPKTFGLYGFAKQYSCFVIGIGYGTATVTTYTWPFDDNTTSSAIVCAENRAYNMSLMTQVNTAGAWASAYVNTADAWDSVRGGIDMKGTGETTGREATPWPGGVGLGVGATLWAIELEFTINEAVPSGVTSRPISLSFSGSDFGLSLYYYPLTGQYRLTGGYVNEYATSTYTLVVGTTYKLTLERPAGGTTLMVSLRASGAMAFEHTFAVTDTGTDISGIRVGSSSSNAYLPATVTNLKVASTGV